MSAVEFLRDRFISLEEICGENRSDINLMNCSAALGWRKVVTKNTEIENLFFGFSQSLFNIHIDYSYLFANYDNIV